MSVEGMWAFATGSVGNPSAMVNSGIIILETGRLFGGDSAVAYVGDYEVAGGEIHGEVETFQYNRAVAVENVFGRSPDNHRVSYRATIEGERMRGLIWETGNPSASLPMELLFLRALP